MLTLLLLRHAKSSWDDAQIDDFERPLADRGRTAAPLMGRFIALNQLQPQLVLCSSAVRTQATLDLVVPELGGDPPAVSYDDQLYLASASTLLSRLAKVPSKWQRVMMVGHNPGLHDLALLLAGAGDGALKSALAAKFPTAALAVLMFESERWQDVKARSGHLTVYTTPGRVARG